MYYGYHAPPVLSIIKDETIMMDHPTSYHLDDAALDRLITAMLKFDYDGSTPASMIKLLINSPVLAGMAVMALTLTLLDDPKKRITSASFFGGMQ